MFSDFAYLDRAITLCFILCFTIHRICSVNGLSSLSINAIRRVELKSVALILILISMVSMIIYDWIAAYIKYSEGYYVDAVTGLIITRPKEKYSLSNRILFPSISVLMNLSWTLQSSGLFLLLALWNHTAKAMLNHKFMSSWEFKAYGIYSLISVVIYPFLQIAYFLSNNIIVSALLPLLVYHVQSIILLVLSQIAARRFKKLKTLLPATSAANGRINYYSKLNSYLSVSLVLNIVGLGVITIDSLTTDALYYNKFLLDFLTKLFNTGFCLTYLVVILILLPPESKIATLEAASKAKLSSYSPDSLLSPASTRFPGSPSFKLQSPPRSVSDRIIDRDTKGYFKFDLPSPTQASSRDADSIDRFKSHISDGK